MGFPPVNHAQDARATFPEPGIPASRAVALRTFDLVQSRPDRKTWNCRGATWCRNL